MAGQKLSSCKLSHLERCLKAVDKKTLSAAREDHHDVPVVEQHCEQLTDYKKQLATIYENLLTLNLKEDDSLIVLHARVERNLFEYSHPVKRLLTSYASQTTSASSTNSRGVPLPKLYVQTFDGNILHWRQFYEQFRVAVHNRSNLSNAEKLVYLSPGGRQG